MMVPARVFSKPIRRVGQACTSSEMIALDLMSANVRWCPFEGRIGIANAPENEAMPPASLIRSEWHSFNLGRDSYTTP